MSSDLALDFGSVTTRIANARGVIIYEQPTIAAVSEEAKVPSRFGNEARGAGVLHSGRLRIVRPVKAGQLADVQVAEAYLEHCVKGLGYARLRRRRVLATMPLGTTPVQLRAMERALERAGVHRVRFLEQPIASGLGARVPIEEPIGSMVVDVGGEITNLAVIALGGVVVGTTIPIGGETLDRAVAAMLLERADLVVDLGVVAAARRELGSLEVDAEDAMVEIQGRDRTKGVPHSLLLGRADVVDVLERELQPLFGAATKLISSSPPDLANDLLAQGIELAGGGSLVPGLSHRLALATGIAVHEHRLPTRLGVLGAARCLATFDDLEDALTAAPAR